MSMMKAHRAVFLALRDGTMAKQPCVQCGRLPAVAHHDDYSKPLDVIWLCRKHHTELHLARGDIRGENTPPPMQRIGISLPLQQTTWLQREAKRLGVTIGELVRRLLDQVRDAQPAKEQRRG